MRKLLALVTIGSLLASGCASAGAPRVQTSAATPADPALFASYVKQLPIGSRVRVDLAGGKRIKGTLMKAGDTAIVVQPRTRIPEPPVEVPLATVVAVELEQGGGTGRAIGIAAAAGAGAALAVLLVLAAIFAGD